MMERFQSSSTEFSFKGKLQTYKILQVFSLLLHCPFPAINALCLIHLTWNMLRFSMNLCMKCCCISLRNICLHMSERSPPQEHSWFVLSNAVITRGTCQKFRKSNEVARYNCGLIIFLPKWPWLSLANRCKKLLVRCYNPFAEAAYEPSEVRTNCPYTLEVSEWSEWYSCKLDLNIVPL